MSHRLTDAHRWLRIVALLTFCLCWKPAFAQDDRMGNATEAVSQIERAVSELYQSRSIRIEASAVLLLMAVALQILVIVRRQEWFKQRQTVFNSLVIVAILAAVIVVFVCSSESLSALVFPSARIQGHLRLARVNSFHLMRSSRFAVTLLIAAAIVVVGSLLLRRQSRQRWMLQSLILFSGVLGLAFVIDSTIIARRMRQLEQRLIKDYPDSSRARRERNRLRQETAAGQPFELDFTDAISGREISVAAMRGKIIVVDFWATWCGPCRSEMPEMKRLYEKHHPQDVEFIGISQDLPVKEGGLDALIAYVAQHEIPWPQCYFDVDSSTDDKATMSRNPSTIWGVNEIPTVFVIDQQGKIYSTRARGKLDQIISELKQRSTSSR